MEYRINLDYQKDVYDDNGNFIGHGPKIMKTITVNADNIKDFCKDEKFDNIMADNLERYLLNLLRA